MSSGGWMMVVAVAIAVGTLVLLFAAVARSIRNERSAGVSVWKDFSLSLVLVILFLGSWIAHGITEWQVFTDDQRSHGEAVKIGDFMSHFMQSTLENWQSEFLQLFSFVVLAALYIHKGSGESKDSDDRMEATLTRIEQRLDALAATREIN